MSSQLSTAATTLVSRFRRQRPLRGGSLLVTIFGDAIAPRGGAIMLGSLIELAAPFGLNERLVRTAMARLADEGWLDNRRLGRLSEYRLSRAGRERFATATQQIYGVPRQPWKGLWTALLVPTNRRAAKATREAARDALAWAGFGEVSAGLFVHPALLPAELEQLLAGTAALSQAILFTTASASPDSSQRLAALGWDLGELANRYRRFLAQFSPALEALDRREPAAPLPSFLLRTLLIHEYRKIHLRDPLLPAGLLPEAWVGADAYRLCRAIYARLAPVAEAHLDSSAASLAGPLPAATAEFWGRFGGLKETRR